MTDQNSSNVNSMSGGDYASFQSLVSAKLGEDDIIIVTDQASSRIASTSKVFTVKFPGDRPEKRLFAKINPLVDSSTDQLSQRFKTFEKEIFFYSHIRPALSLPSILECLGVGRCPEGLCILLEDFVSEGFVVPEANEFMSQVAAKRYLEEIARFHAASLTATEKPWLDEANQEVMKDHVYGGGNDEFVGAFFCSSMETHLKMVRAAIEESLVTSKIGTVDLDKIISLAPRMQKVLGQTRDRSRSPDVNVLMHGDFHMWNVATKKDEVRLFDFQVICIGPFACDLHQFLSQAIAPKVRKENLDLLLESYKLTLLKECKERGMPDDDPILATFSSAMREEYVKSSPMGLLFGLSFVLPRFVEDSEKFEVAKTSSSSADIVRALKESGKRIPEVLQMLADHVEEYVELGVCQVIDEILGD